jgi:Antitoxin VbhA
MPYKTNQKALQTAVNNALANQRMEGLEPEARVVLDLQRFARGECEIGVVLSKFKARIARGEVLQ